MKQRFITSIVLLIIGLLLVYTSLHSFLFLLLLVGFFATYEIYSIKANTAQFISAILAFSTLLTTILSIDLKWFFVMIALHFMITLILVTKFEEYTIVDFAIFNSLLFVLSGAFYTARQLYLEVGPHSIIWLACCSFGSDIGAYLIGRKFGKHPLNPRLSPNKTIEGSLGGWLLGFLCGALIVYFLIGEASHMVYVLSLVIPLISQLGDLFFSSIKRYYQRKDFGFILPGHGGVLDRLDSIILSLFFVTIVMIIF